MPNNDSKTYIVNDQPTEKDALDFTPYVETLADIIQTGNTPLTIGVFGTWGSGKTSLMKMVKNGIPESEYGGLPKDYTVAWFDAWKYDKEESLWRAFLLCVLSALKEKASLQGNPVDEFEKLQSLIYRDMEIEKVGGVTIDLAKLGSVTAKGLAQLSLSFIPGLSSLTKLVEELQSGAAKNVDEATAAIRRERTKIHIEQIQFLEQFQDKFRKLVDGHVIPNRLVVFIDDLDRCLPENAIEVLEAIKLFLDVENCVFLLGLDQEVIAKGIELKYKDHELTGKVKSNSSTQGVRYLEKIIQLPFQIPAVGYDDMDYFVRSLVTKWPHAECPKIFIQGLKDNPRQIKRSVNTFLLLWGLRERREDKLGKLINPVRLAKIVIIQTIAPDLYDEMKLFPSLLRELELYFRQEDKKLNRDSASRRENQSLETISTQGLSQLLQSYISNQSLQRVLTIHPETMPDANFHDLNTEEIIPYFTLSSYSRVKIDQFIPVYLSQEEIANLRAGLQDYQDITKLGKSISDARKFDAEGRLPKEFSGSLIQAVNKYTNIRQVHSEITKNLDSRDLSALLEVSNKIQEIVASGDKYIYNINTNSEIPSFEVLQKLQKKIDEISQQEINEKIKTINKAIINNPNLAKEIISSSLEKTYPQHYQRLLENKFFEVEQATQDFNQAINLIDQAATESNPVNSMKLAVEASTMFPLSEDIRLKVSNVREQAITNLKGRFQDIVLKFKYDVDNNQEGDFGNLVFASSELQTLIVNAEKLYHSWPEPEIPEDLKQAWQNVENVRKRNENLVKKMSKKVKRRTYKNNNVDK